jgi:hypothetical protein
MLARNLLTRIWLTFKQQRFETIAIAAVCIGLTAAALIEAFRLNSINVPFSCFQSWQGPLQYQGGNPLTAEQLRCAPLVESFQNLQQSVDMNVVRLMLLLTPILVGMIYGAPVVARELEQGTAPLSWALSGSRRRWLLGKMLAGVVLIVPLMLAVGLAANVLQSALSPGINVYSAFDNYMGRGVIVVFWALAAYAGTLALGSLIGRTLPALIVALVICFFARALWEPAMTHFVLRPFAVQQVQQDQQQQGYVAYGWGGPASADMTIYYKSFIDGKEVTDAQANDWYNQNMVCVPMSTPTPGAPMSPGDSGSPGAPSSSGAPATSDNGKPVFGGTACETPAIDQSHFPQQIPYAIPGSWYWQTVAMESGMLLLGALFCAAVAMFRVERRRPY